MIDQAIWSHILTSHHAVPLMFDRGGRGTALIVEITDGDFYGYRGNIFYDLVKSTVIRLAFIQARELRKQDVAAVAVTPGFLRSEFMLEHFGVTKETWRDGAKKDPNFIASESPLYVGRGIAALAADPNVKAKSGKVFASWTLAAEYGFTDADGSRPDWGCTSSRRSAGGTARSTTISTQRSWVLVRRCSPTGRSSEHRRNLLAQPFR
jgi:NAD(P)-dependent dehydrogenase (short-subunit alcohol dehydrogenase family)